MIFVSAVGATITSALTLVSGVYLLVPSRVKVGENYARGLYWEW